jgi:hypothetical protein
MHLLILSEIGSAKASLWITMHFVRGNEKKKKKAISSCDTSIH